ncbi:Cytochrome c biogenesis protein CcsA [Aquisphaera giovannonii]|uniref:Cytochrome c biogenesis protein CcsA n=1 Tax=Aquisphaera giovannonii TaxID=406548 RepID=A0A5B9VZG5_9BACT|nr:cytochrome c biogenesis protein CcsA [Aquisphaera giovannonii]QEH33371.1 Cytochrome c biogenesis protein CcsA [Aquisphaera giovannonii]
MEGRRAVLSLSAWRWVAAGLAVAAATATPARAAEPKVEDLGRGPAYARVGELAVMHAGRIKPLDTVAREEIKAVFGRESIKLRDAEGRVVASWGPVAAFLDWMVRPEFWDDQPFILVDYGPLRQKVLDGALKQQLKDIASRAPESERPALQALAAGPELTAAAVNDYVRSGRLDDAGKKAVAAIAHRLGEEAKWLSPREIEDAKIAGHGDPEPFMQWASELNEQKERYDANPKSAAKLSETERRALEVARRLMTYKAVSGDETRSATMIRVMPRPSSAKAMGYLAGVIKKARESKDVRSLSPLEFDVLKALDTYWDAIPRDQRRDPGEDPKFDERFGAWLRENSAWVPLKAFVKSGAEDLIAAGYPEAETRAFLAAYKEMTQAEDREPGHLAEPLAAAMLDSSRKLGEAVAAGHYATVAAIERETHFNAMNPFWLAPFGYGAAFVLLILTIVSGAFRPGAASKVGKGLYAAGVAALVGGIAMEIYGFYLRIRISGWAPVTNMYETVIWVALVSAVLSVVLEGIYRKVFAALGGSAVALLGTLTAVNVPLLDPSIGSLMPVLRSNFWLTIHVLTIVSSYAAFGLAWMLGLIATTYYLTAVYKRSPTYRELAMPLVPGIGLLAAGILGVAAASMSTGSNWGASDIFYYICAFVAEIGGMVALAGLLAMAGEFLNRRVFRDALRDAAAAELHGELADEARGPAYAGSRASAMASAGGGVATLARPTAAQIFATEKTAWGKLDARGLAMQETAATIKPISNLMYRAMQVGVLLVAAGTILGGVWADYSWGRFWGWDAKEVWALITLLVYLVPLHGRFAGWVNTFGLVCASVVCFLSVIMAWYGVNFVLGVGLHSYGFVEGGSQGAMSVIIFAVLAIPLAAAWRRTLGYRMA